MEPTGREPIQIFALRKFYVIIWIAWLLIRSDYASVIGGTTQEERCKQACVKVEWNTLEKPSVIWNAHLINSLLKYVRISGIALTLGTQLTVFIILVKKPDRLMTFELKQSPSRASKILYPDNYFGFF